jgi:hypothetical protein
MALATSTTRRRQVLLSLATIPAAVRSARNWMGGRPEGQPPQPPPCSLRKRVGWFLHHPDAVLKVQPPVRRIMAPRAPCPSATVSLDAGLGA